MRNQWAPSHEPTPRARRSGGHGAVVYDFLLRWGGAESVTLTLASRLEEAEVWVAFRDAHLFPAAHVADTRVRELGRPPRLPLRAWRTLSGLQLFKRKGQCLRDYDWAVFSGSNAPAAVRHRPQGGNVYYCHTPPRLAYDLYDWYLDRLPAWQRGAFRALAHHVRTEYEAALAQMQTIVANSTNVRDRLARYIGLDAAVVYPPCDVSAFAWQSQGDYFVSTARLERYKRVDLIIEAFRRMPDRTLVVTSGGADEARLRRLAADAANIRFVGWQSPQALRELIGGARATIYVPKDEDFGLSPVESMAAGKPVIGVAEGGIRETVVDGETGVLLEPEPAPESLVAAVRSLTAERAASMRAACERRAQAFSTERFVSQMRETIEAVRVDPGTRA